MLEQFYEDSISEKSPKSLEDLCAKISSYFPGADLELIERAYVFSEKAHSGQIRRSGEPYISHPLGVAAILADSSKRCTSRDCDIFCRSTSGTQSIDSDCDELRSHSSLTDRLRSLFSTIDSTGKLAVTDTSCGWLVIAEILDFASSPRIPDNVRSIFTILVQA